MKKKLQKIKKSRIFQIILPVFITIGLFVFIIFYFILPFIKDSMLSSKRKMIKELTSTTYEILSYYNKKVKAGNLSINNAKNQAITQIRMLRYGPEKKDYFWINDFQPRMIMHPYRTDLDGKDLTDFVDQNGKHLFVEFVKITKKYGSGFVNYMWQWKDDSTRIVPKISYVKEFKPWGWIIGTGIYIEDINKEISIITHRLQKIIMIVFSIIILLLIYIIWQNIKIEKNKIMIEESFELSESKFRALVKSSTDWIWELNTDGVYTYSSSQVEHILGYKPEELIGKKPFFHMASDEGIKTNLIYNNLIKKTMPIVMLENVNLHKDNKPITLVTSAVPFFNKEGHVIGFRGVNRNITELKKQQLELQYLRNYLSNIIDSMPSILIGVDINGRVTQWNKKSTELTGIEPKEAYGKLLSDVFPDMSSEMKKITESIRIKEIIYEQKKQRYSENGICYEDVTIYPLTANGIDGAVIRIDDVTENARMEEIMIQSEKMLSVGGLAAGMAHEINNPLAGMIQTSNVISLRLGGNINIPANLKAAEKAGTSIDAIRKYMEDRGIPRMITTINESGKRVASIVKNMLSFARKSDSHKLPHFLPEIIDNTIKLAASDYDLKKHFDFKLIEIINEYEKDLPEIYCEHTKIQQVILNILHNGSQAMHEANISKPKFFIRLKYEKNINMVCIEIEDNGPGMDDDIRKRIFEPFFTTKAVGVGTGLGLSVSYFIITENHGGDMEVESQPGKGTKFIIRLPVKDPHIKNDEIK